ncbi:hypothetical protein IFVP136_C1120023 [Vibrio parahaemolyticus]
MAAENELGGAEKAELERTKRNRVNKYFMIKVFKKYDFNHSTTQRLAFVMSLLIIKTNK